MRYIVPPHDILVTPPVDAPPGVVPELLSFRKYAFQCWLDDNRAFAEGTGTSFVRQVRWAKVIDAFARVEAGVPLALEDADYATLRSIAEAPQRTFLPTVAVQLLAFTHAVLDARDSPPAEAHANGGAHDVEARAS